MMMKNIENKGKPMEGQVKTSQASRLVFIKNSKAIIEQVAKASSRRS